MVINGIFKGVYLRGVISIGKFYQTQNLIIWPAWWRNELASLGLVIKKRNEFNNLEDLCSLAENIKQTFIHNYVDSEKTQTQATINSQRSIKTNSDIDYCWWAAQTATLSYSYSKTIYKIETYIFPKKRHHLLDIFAMNLGSRSLSTKRCSFVAYFHCKYVQTRAMG